MSRTQPMRKNPTGGPERIRATSHAKSLRRANLALRRSANRSNGPGNTRQGPATRSCSRNTRWAARSSVVHPSSRVGTDGPSSSKRSQSSRRSCASSGTPATKPESIRIRTAPNRRSVAGPKASEPPIGSSIPAPRRLPGRAACAARGTSSRRWCPYNCGPRSAWAACRRSPVWQRRARRRPLLSRRSPLAPSAPLSARTAFRHRSRSIRRGVATTRRDRCSGSRLVW